MTKRVVVVGGGYGGVAFIKRLRVLSPDSTVTLIDRNTYHTVLTELHQVAAGNLAPHMFQVPFADMEATRFIQAEVTTLDPEARRIMTSAGPVEYDYLVLALGGVDTDFGVAGVREHALMLHSMKDALAIRDRVDALPDGAPILVAGGGLTGVELAAELGARFRGAGNVTLVEASPAILPSLSKVLQLAARRRLGALGVNVMMGARIERVAAGMVHFTGGSALPFGLMVWACGVRANPLIAGFGLPVDRAGRAVVDANLQTAYPGVYAIGDSATGLAPTAQAANQQGMALAAHVAGLVAGRAVAVRQVKLMGTLVDLGHSAGAGSVGAMQLDGYLPALLKRANVARWLYTAAGLAAAARYFLGLGPKHEHLSAVRPSTHEEAGNGSGHPNAI
jgi:NADH:ubiquinone reductase (H+-translocating)